MSRDEIIDRIRTREEQIRALGASALYIFGSCARDELGEGSDVDVFIDQAPGFDFRFAHLTGLEALLRGVLDRPVDVMTRSSLHPLLRPAIEASALRVL
jgi:predicted nucleotidyltransferase